jgi:hypothetical protein
LIDTHAYLANDGRNNNQENDMSNEPDAPAVKLPSAFALFKPSYEALMVNIWTFLVLLFLPIAGGIVSSSSGAFGQDPGTTREFTLNAITIFSLLTVVVGLLVAPAVPYVQLKSVHGQEVTIGEALKAGKKYFWRFYGLAILSGLMVLGGFLLLIVPGFFMIKRYMLAPFYMYDRNLSIPDAMRWSRADAKPFAYAIWGLIGVSAIIGFLGVIPWFAVAAAILQVVYYCAPTVRYEQIKEATVGASKPKSKKSKKKSA